MVDATALDGCISTDRVEAFPPEQLATSPDILNVGKAVVVLRDPSLKGDPPTPRSGFSANLPKRY
jgi:hypothetical protein